MPYLFDDGSAAANTRSERVLHTPGTFARETLLYVQETGSLVSLRPHLCRRENQKSYLFALVLEGSGTFRSDGAHAEMHPGDCAFIDCMRPYAHISSAADPWKLIWVHFAGRSMPNYYRYYKETQPSPFFAADNPKDYAAILTELFRLTREAAPGSELIASELLHRLVTRILTQGAPNAAADKLENVRKYLDEHYAESLPLEALSSRFFISKYHLSRAFAARFHTTIGEYLLRRRVTSAKALLRFSDKAVSEIAKDCGVPDANYFSKVFLKAEGVTPTAFRKQWQPGAGSSAAEPASSRATR